MLLQLVNTSKTSPGSWHHHNIGHEHASHDCIVGDCHDGPSTVDLDLHGPHSGEYLSGKIVSGRGVHKLNRGHFYRGNFENSKWHGVGVLHRGSTTYHGRWHHDNLNGPVTTTLRNGSIWTSHFHNSAPWNGKTRWAWCIDDSRSDCLEHGTYLGEWLRGRPNGLGIFTNGTLRYEGHWTDGSFANLGVIMVENKYRYDGQFSMGMMHGEGIYWDLVKHTKYWGSFVDGKRDGIGYLKTPGFLFGFNIVKNIWRNGVQKANLPHREL